MTNFSMFDAYRRENTRDMKGHGYCSVDHLLRFWRQAKGEYLMPLFGEDLILERPIAYNRSNDELRTDMRDMISEQRDAIEELTEGLREALGIKSIWSDDSENSVLWRYLNNCLQNVSTLLDNNVCMSNLMYNINRQYDKLSYTFTMADGKKITLQSGQKITRVWGQIAKMIGLESTWERVRIAHSQVLNQRTLKGTLCLSIHPLDYATASDNDNGWSSCMSWRDYGCYRLGTVEMMNSPMVICAYVKSNKQHMEIDGQEWNSKKWRAWIIVNKDMIVCNRHYPFHQPKFAKEACNWVAELVGAKYGWEYDEVHENFYDYMEDALGDHIELLTTYMYNDLGDDDIIGMLRKNKKHMPGYVNFSGAAECMVCGCEIEEGDQEADALECLDCYSELHCYSCGDSVNDDEYYTNPNGEIMCYSCFREECRECADCGRTMWSEDATEVSFPIYQKQARSFLDRSENVEVKQRFCTWSGTLRLQEQVETDNSCLCNECARKLPLVTVRYPYDVANESDVEVDTITVFDPARSTVEEAFEWLNPDGWYWAHHYGATHHQAESRGIDAFWRDQWSHFENDYFGGRLLNYRGDPITPTR